ncbi:hypothetical protein B4U80_12716 [Leptotrombidium deliense]|uniref:Uncharacterized protein n=1 Tax=Leptotrombidium deliense TaxID=299467 RepID=A0A443SPX1_9ACAR|nr:hypothetical protein B4U80_12716 [Leptotrombidium deliense]
MSSWPTGNGSHFTLRQQPVQDSKSLDEINGCFDFNEINANSSDNKWKLFLRKLRVEINRQLSQLTGHWPHFYIDPKELATLHEWDVRPHQGATTMQHISPESRLKSFTNWPETGAIVPELLADAGFFYVGKKSNF